MTLTSALTRNIYSKQVHKMYILQYLPLELIFIFYIYEHTSNVNLSMTQNQHYHQPFRCNWTSWGADTTSSSSVNGTWADLYQSLRAERRTWVKSIHFHPAHLCLKSHFCHTCLLFERSDTKRRWATPMTSFTASLTDESLSLSCKQTHHLVPLW